MSYEVIESDPNDADFPNHVSIRMPDGNGMMIPIGDLEALRNTINAFLHEYAQRLMKESI